MLDAGIRLILYLQSLGDGLVSPAQFFSFLGREEFFLMIMPALYWCLDAGLGLRVGIMLLVSNGLNAGLKYILHGPRPYFYSAQVQALSSETSFGIPSAHAQNAMAVWGLLAALVGRRWKGYGGIAWILAALLVLLIGLSRVYLGVHFPQDVVFGWAIGAILVWAFLRLEAPFRSRLSLQTLPNQILAVFTASLVMLLLGASFRLSLAAWTVPAGWLENVALAGESLPAPDPLALAPVLTSAGALFGLAAGAIWLRHQGGFEAGGPAWKRIVRYPVGLAGVLVLWYGLGAVFPSGELLLPYFLRYLRYALVGFWMSALAPLVFIRLGLAEKQNRRGDPSLTFRQRDEMDGSPLRS